MLIIVTQFLNMNILKKIFSLGHEIKNIKCKFDFLK